MSYPNPRHCTEIDSASFESLIIFPSLSDLFEVDVALLVFHPLRIVSPPSAPRFGNAEMAPFLHCQDEINGVFVVVANLTVSDPLRIQLWSQGRLNETKSSRKNDGKKTGKLDRRKNRTRKVASKKYRRQEGITEQIDRQKETRKEMKKQQQKKTAYA